uniref:Uncharacterized protein n=1 Tax=Knipowitschia caucasica TaxID=637954 RepID=A0AAV2LER7_KNICA
MTSSMMFRTLLFCAVAGVGCALGCRWMEHKYPQFRDSSLGLLKAMREEKLKFMGQLLDEIVALFEEDQTSAPWQETVMDDFLNIISQQADGLRACVSSQNLKRKSKKLSMYFKRLSTLLEQTSHSTQAWEWIRTEVKVHLQRADLLVPAKTN